MSCTRCKDGTSLVTKEDENYGYCLQCPEQCTSCTAPAGSMETGIFSAELGDGNHNFKAAKIDHLHLENALDARMEVEVSVGVAAHQVARVQPSLAIAPVCMAPLVAQKHLFRRRVKA